MVTLSMSLKHPPKSLVGLDNRDKSDLFITFVLLPTPLKISSDWERQLALSISFFSVENIKKCPNQKYLQFLESIRKVEKYITHFFYFWKMTDLEKNRSIYSKYFCTSTKYLWNPLVTTLLLTLNMNFMDHWMVFP